MPVKVLVVDDDDIAGGLSRDLLAEAGFEADLQLNSLKALDQIRANRYPLVVLDILMPGLDGLTLCHQIKSDAELKDTKVVMVSGKSFEADKQRAAQYGASLFIEKPYNVDLFIQQIQEVMGRPTGPQAAAAAPKAETLASKAPVMNLTVWGCRSGGPAGAGPSRYGRKTSCLSLDLGEHFLIFDAGTGLADLGKTLAADPARKEAWLFLTHFHDDHVQGLPAFAPAAKQGFLLHVAGAHEPDKTLEQHVATAFQSAPATIPGVSAEIDLYDLLEDTYEILPGVKLTSFYSNHPGITLGFILEAKNRKVAYVPDSECYGETATAMQDYDEKLSRLVRGSDLLIHDARYTTEDYRTLRNRGHSGAASIVDVAGRSDVKRLLLWHHETSYSDEALDQLGAKAAQQAVDKAYAVQVALAREGLTIGV
jgi:phosphoribosyl 1,2-cyclic phosphodiesterase/CheY-like chemotaxis protein